MDVKCVLAYVIMTTLLVTNGHKLRPVYKKLFHLEDTIYAHREHWKNEMDIFHNMMERKFLNRVVRQTLPKLIEKKLLDILKSGVLDIAVDNYNYQRMDRMFHQHQIIKVHMARTYRQMVGAIALVRKSNRESQQLTRQIKSLQNSVSGFKSIIKEVLEDNARLNQALSGIENKVMGLAACFPSDAPCGLAKDRSTRVVSIHTWEPALTTEASSGLTAEDVGQEAVTSTITSDVMPTKETPVLTTGTWKLDIEDEIFSTGSGEHKDPVVLPLAQTTDVRDSFNEDLVDEELLTLIPREESVSERTSAPKTTSETTKLPSTLDRETTTLIRGETSKLTSHPSTPLTTVTASATTTHTDHVEASTSKTQHRTIVTRVVTAAAVDRATPTAKQQTSTPRQGDWDIQSLIGT
ncbi:serine-rich adhesin for platelets-like isoform X1 [Haliotis cracherodii]|uniref:serine-rich adhesin for platelets-like isoform X1 n=1 Tax=Haliotis cracherodii TaxID=6455 RepID=UPI0039E7DD07